MLGQLAAVQGLIELPRAAQWTPAFAGEVSLIVNSLHANRWYTKTYTTPCR